MRRQLACPVCVWLAVGVDRHRLKTSIRVVRRVWTTCRLASACKQAYYLWCRCMQVLLYVGASSSSVWPAGAFRTAAAVAGPAPCTLHLHARAHTLVVLVDY